MIHGQAVCINDNGLLCIKQNDYDNSALALKDHFGESACGGNSSRVSCESDAFTCHAYSNGTVYCSGSSPDENCMVDSFGYVECI